MKSACSHPKRNGAATTAATGTGAEEEGCGTAGDISATGELETSAEEGRTKELEEDLMEAVLKEENLRAAYLVVKANKGAPGIDWMTVEELGEHLKRNWPGLKEKLKEGRYKPSPVRAVEIEKAGGGHRRLGIPTVQDRFIQQAMHQVLDGELDPHFSEHSYGYRRNRSAHDAVRAAHRYVNEEGRRWVIDIDIRAYFDTIDHDILMRLVGERVRDKRLLKLIGKYLRCGVLEKGEVKRSAQGTPQGGPLSPLLGNIYLDTLDKELERRGVSFCRYADDITIYARSERSAKRTYESIVKWIEKNLKLEVNREKSGVRPPEEGSFLEFRIEKDGRIAISQKSITRFKMQVREHWDKQGHLSGREVLENWQSCVRGWIGYYRLSERAWDWEDLEGWIRRHIRKWFWQRWHNWKGRSNAFRRLGVGPRHWAIAHSSRGAWRMAGVLNVILPNRWLREHGFWMPSDLVKAQQTVP